MWCLDRVRAGRLSESSAPFVILVGLFAFQFAVLFIVLLHEVGLWPPTACSHSPPSRLIFMLWTGCRLTFVTKCVPTCRPWWLWPHGPCIRLGACPVDRRRLWHVSWACWYTARGSVPLWRASNLLWQSTTSRAGRSSSWWSDSCNPRSTLRDLQRIARPQLQRWLRLPRHIPPPERCTIFSWICGTLGTGGSCAPWCCPQFLGWGDRALWCARSWGLGSWRRDAFWSGEHEQEETVLAPPIQM